LQSQVVRNIAEPLLKYINMRIGIDCDGVLRNFDGSVIRRIRETHPNLIDKVIAVRNWDIKTWLPFWSAEESTKYIFDDNYQDIFENAPICRDAKEQWTFLLDWAIAQGHELVLVSAQRPKCISPTLVWLGKHGFSFKELHFTKNKEVLDIDVLVDDYEDNLIKFSNAGKISICFSHKYNTDIQDLFPTIKSLKELPSFIDDLEEERSVIESVDKLA